jgi:hypothetical protein
MRNACIKLYGLATRHKGAALGLGALAAVLAVKLGANPDIHYYG